uniref:DUF7781 domain-containing protein n=1 Tax=Aegilops tauschii TaxID=37682 RepID=M8C3A3_AEGTA
MSIQEEMYMEVEHILNFKGDGPTTLDELYHINVVPAELHFKFRKELQGLRVGLNFEFYNLEVNDFEAKVVLKPLDFDRKWKFQYKPISGLLAQENLPSV